MVISAIECNADTDTYKGHRTQVQLIKVNSIKLNFVMGITNVLVGNAIKSNWVKRSKQHLSLERETMGHAYFQKKKKNNMS